MKSLKVFLSACSLAACSYVFAAPTVTPPPSSNTATRACTYQYVSHGVSAGGPNGAVETGSFPNCDELAFTYQPTTHGVWVMTQLQTVGATADQSTAYCVRVETVACRIPLGKPCVANLAVGAPNIPGSCGQPYATEVNPDIGPMD